MEKLIGTIFRFVGDCLFFGVFIGGLVWLIAHADAAAKKSHPQPYTYWEILEAGKHFH
jgi:hypothetical protein